jgi:hypothetical protein
MESMKACGYEECGSICGVRDGERGFSVFKGLKECEVYT